MDPEKKEYVVTELAGHFVAGQRSPGTDGKIWLTPEQAMFALSAGQLIDPTLPPRKPKAPAAEPETAPAEAEAPAPKKKGKTTPAEEA